MRTIDYVENERSEREQFEDRQKKRDWLLRPIHWIYFICVYTLTWIGLMAFDGLIETTYPVLILLAVLFAIGVLCLWAIDRLCETFDRLTER